MQYSSYNVWKEKINMITYNDLQNRLNQAIEHNLDEEIIFLADLNGFTNYTYKVEGSDRKIEFRKYILEFFERCVYKADMVRNDWKIINIVGDAIILSLPITGNYDINRTFFDVIKIAKKIDDWTRRYGLLSVKCAIDIGYMTEIVPYQQDNVSVLPKMYIGTVLNRISRMLSTGQIKKKIRVSEKLYSRLNNFLKNEFVPYKNISRYPEEILIYKSEKYLSKIPTSQNNS